MLDADLRQRRETIVLDHFADEVSQDFDKVLSTFPHPRYEIIPTAAVHDGRDAVMRYYHDTRRAFPDQRHEMIQLRHSDDAVICEFWLLGTHKGPFGALPPTGQTFRVRMTAYFIFDGDRLICERIYFDTLTMLRQLLRGVSWKRPASLITLIRFIRGARKELRQ